MTEIDAKLDELRVDMRELRARLDIIDRELSAQTRIFNRLVFVNAVRKAACPIRVARFSSIPNRGSVLAAGEIAILHIALCVA